MIKCKYCGGENPDENKFCMNCGAPLDHDAQDAVEQQAYPEQTYAPEPEQVPAEQDFSEPPHYDPVPDILNPPVERVPIGGLIAWAVFVILGCWIPGVVALYYILKINKAASFEEQQQLISNAKKILIVGTVLSVLNLLRMIGAGAD